MLFPMVSLRSCLHTDHLLTVIEPGFYEDGKFGVRIESVYPI